MTEVERTKAFSTTALMSVWFRSCICQSHIFQRPRRHSDNDNGK